MGDEAAPAFEPFAFPIEAGKIREFAFAIRDDNPLYFDAAEAKRLGFADVPAPPTYPMLAGIFQPEGRMQLPRGIDVRRVLHGEQEFIYYRPIVAGDVLTGVTRLAGTERKEGRRGGTMKLYTLETEYRDPAGEVVLLSRMLLIETGRALPR
jgi:hypothetical protein